VLLSPIQRRTLRAFLRAVALAEPLQRELAASHGISLGDLYAVRVLARLGEVPVSRYGAELGLARSTITNLVDRLERAELVARVASPDDRRVTLVRLTPAGLDAMEALLRFAESDVARRLLALDEVDQAALSEILERVLVIPAEPDGDTSSETSDEPELVTATEPESGR
jgi:MarR family transcriptional regulator, organic hydroperoxide resistance regulator